MTFARPPGGGRRKRGHSLQGLKAPGNERAPCGRRSEPGPSGRRSQRQLWRACRFAWTARWTRPEGGRGIMRAYRRPSGPKNKKEEDVSRNQGLKAPGNERAPCGRRSERAIPRRGNGPTPCGVCGFAPNQTVSCSLARRAPDGCQGLQSLVGKGHLLVLRPEGGRS